MPEFQYVKLGSPSQRIVDPRYIIEYKNERWGTNRLSYKSLLLSIQLHYAIPPEEYPAYLLNQGNEELVIRRLSGNKAAENLTLREVYGLCHGKDAWDGLREQVRKGRK